VIPNVANGCRPASRAMRVYALSWRWSIASICGNNCGSSTGSLAGRGLAGLGAGRLRRAGGPAVARLPWCQGAAWARRDEIGLRLVNWVWAEWLLRLRWSGLGVGSLWRDGDRIDGPGHPADGTHAPFLGHHAPGLGRRIRSHSVRIRLEHEGSASLQTLIDLVPAGGTTRHPRAAIPAMPPA